MKETKETEEQTWFNLRKKHTLLSLQKDEGSLFEMCKLYHQERLSFLLPTEEEIDDRYPDKTGNGNMLEGNLCRREAAKDLRNKLLKG